jgi:PDZ domain-containing protein
LGFSTIAAMRSLTPARVAVAALLLAAVAVVVLYLIPSNKYYVFIPDRAHALAPLVKVPGEHVPQNGGVYFVDVRFRKARLLEQLLGRPLAHGATLVQVHDVLARGVTEKQQRRIDLSQMQESQKIAAAVALSRLGYQVRIRLPKVVVQGVEPKAPAHEVLRSGDELLAVNGRRVSSLGRLHELVTVHTPGDRLRIRYRRSGRVATATIRTIPNPTDRHEAVIGILVRESGGSTGRLPIRVRIDTRGVGGPSAGLAFALDLMEELGHDIDHGHKVAATGELALDGSVIPIGAVKQKTIGAREAGVDVFLVPAGANAREARKYADGLRIIPVNSFPQALHALATLPEKSPTSA